MLEPSRWSPTGRIVFDQRDRLVAMGGHERRSEAPRLDGLWLRLATLPATPESIVAAAETHGFLRHSGEFMDEWVGLLAHLRTLAGSWDGDPADLSRPELRYAFGPGYHHRAEEAIVDLAELGLRRQDVATVIADLRYETVPRTLFGFLVLQTSDALVEKSAYRRCVHCAGWFLLRRSDQLYCSASHKALHHKKGK
jgi:hypothetical protein